MSRTSTSRDSRSKFRRKIVINPKSPGLQKKQFWEQRTKTYRPQSGTGLHPQAVKSSAFSRGLRVKRPELRGDVGSLAFRTLDLLLLVLRNAHGDCETLVALFAKIFVEGHRRILSVRRKYNGLENLNTHLSARREGLQGMFICQGSPERSGILPPLSSPSAGS